ncbi:MAG TPA: TadE family protein [Anaerolineales bacterium]|nr:TadE family protein [Anaerolineales bacterium]
MRRQTPSHTRGQSLIEFALILPIFLLIVMVLLDLGRAVYYYSVIYNAAREGTRYGTVHPTDGTGIEAAARDLTVGLDQSELVIASTLPADPQTGDIVRVTATYRFRAVTPLANLFIDGGFIDLTSRSTMYIEK